MNNKNLKWGIKTEGGYVNFIHGTLKNIYEFETSQDINDICIFSEVAAHAYSQKIKGIAFPIVLSEQSKLSIPKKIAELLDIGYACEGDEERDHSWLIHNMDDFTSPESYDEFYNWLEDSEDNYSLAIVYLAGQALGVDLVEVEE